jgi:hypothetical protein
MRQSSFGPIDWDAPKDLPGVGGMSLRGGHIVTHNGEKMVDFGNVKINGKMQNLKVRVAGKPGLEAEIKRVEDQLAASAKAKTERINAIPGLRELKDARDDQDRYDSEFSRMMNDQNNDGARPPRGPKASVKELAAKYPRAAAYLRAESFSHASNDVKASAGIEAMRRIENGEDHEVVLKEMENWNHGNAYGD